MTQSSEKKQKGPLRWEAILPFFIIVFVIGLYTHFFLDHHLRMGLQWGLGKALGAEVNVGDLETSFWKAHIKIKDIELTSAEEPTKNSIAIGEIRFGMLWDALLRAKIVINEAAIEQIEYMKPRKHKGWVAPPEPPKQDDGKPSYLEVQAKKISGEALDKVEQENSNNLLGDLAAVLGGSSSQTQIDKIKETLSSQALVQSIEKNIQEKQALWKQKLATLPKEQDFKDLGARLQKVKTKDFKTPQELQASLKEIDQVFKETDAKLKILQTAAGEMDADIKAIQDQVKGLDEEIKADIKRLEAHFKIPSLDAGAVTRAIFMKYLDPYLKKFEVARSLANKYLPPNLMKKSDEPDVSIQPRPRAKGVTYEFGKINGYPLFWLKHAVISSKAGVSEYSGDIKGELLDLTSNQVITGKPTKLHFSGDFPSQNIHGIDATLTVDSRKEKSRIDLNAKVAEYTLGEKTLVASPDANIQLAKSVGTLQIKSSLEGLKELEMSILNSFSQSQYTVSTKNQEATQVLQKIFNDLPPIKVEGRLWGTTPKISSAITSNLGEELTKGLRTQISAKIAETQKKIREYVDQQVGAAKARVDSEVLKMKKQFDQEIQKVQAQANAEKAKAEAQADQAKKAAEKQAQEKINQEKKKLESDTKKAAEKAAQELKKKLGF